MATPAPTHQDVGRTLRGARQTLHVSVEEAAGVTRIPKRFLEALEDNAPLSTYPAPVYARAFLREYARHLGLEPEPLVAALTAGEEPEEFRFASIREAVPPPRRWPARLLLGLSVVLLTGLAVVGIISGRRGIPVVGTVPNHPVAAAPSSAATQPPPPEAHTVSARWIDVKLRISGRCWIEAVADGRSVFKGTLLPSQQKVFRARGTLALTLGNAGGAVLLVNGKPLTTGAPSQVIHLTLSLEHGRVHVTRV